MLLAESVDSRIPAKNKNCICRKTNEKKAIDILPPADTAELELCKRCCVNGKCTINQLLKICQEDPDSIMDAFKIATAEDKCLPDVELDLDVTDDAYQHGDEDENVEPQNKYHFLMVDNSTSLYQLQQESIDLETGMEGDYSKIETETKYEDLSIIRNTESNEVVPLLAKEPPAKTTLKSSVRSTESKYDFRTPLTKSISLERVFLVNCKNIWWSDSDATVEKILPSSIARRARKQSIKQQPSSSNCSNTEKSMSVDERGKNKSIVWSSESYPNSDESSARRISRSWHFPSIGSEGSATENTPSSHLKLIMRKKKEELLMKTEMGVEPPEGSEKMRRKYWPRCFNCFKRRKKTKPNAKSSVFWDSTNETEDSVSYY